MKDIGVQDAKFLELFSVDEASLSFLPWVAILRTQLYRKQSLIVSSKPIHGLIFLYKYAEEELPEAAEGGENIWFANQVGTAFSCPIKS
jgi:hypothetical protein